MHALSIFLHFYFSSPHHFFFPWSLHRAIFCVIMGSARYSKIDGCRGIAIDVMSSANEAMGMIMAFSSFSWKTESVFITRDRPSRLHVKILSLLPMPVLRGKWLRKGQPQVECRDAFSHLFPLQELSLSAGRDDDVSHPSWKKIYVRASRRNALGGGGGVGVCGEREWDKAKRLKITSFTETTFLVSWVVSWNSKCAA